MKTVIVYVDSMEYSGGRERVISNLLKEWVKKYNLILLTKDDGQSFYQLPDTLQIVSLNCPMKLNMDNRISRMLNVGFSLLKSIGKLKSYLKSVKYDYVYTATPLNAFEAYLAMKDPKKKLVISEHASINAFNSIYSRIKLFCYPKAYCISVPNTMDTAEYIKWGCNAVFIPHLVTFLPIQKNSLDSKIILNVGRLTKDKQQNILLRMWERVEDKNDWKLWIVGDGEEKNRLEDLIYELEVQDSVKLIPATQKIHEIYKQASFFSLSSRCEGFGMVLLEAMSFGVPCISFDCPSGPRDVIHHFENGFLIDNMDENQYVKTLEQIVKMSKEELSNMGSKAFSFVEDWNNNKILEQWDKVFK